MYWMVRDDIAMSCLPKNGSMSIRESFKSHRKHSNEEVMSIPRRVAWIRHPLERLHSAYSFFHYLELNGTINPTKELFAHDWESFIDYTFAVDNPHWCLQREALSVDGNYIATESHKFEDMTSKWGSIMPGLLPWLNAVTKKDIHDYRLNELQAKYAEDIQLWHSL